MARKYVGESLEGARNCVQQCLPFQITVCGYPIYGRWEVAVAYKRLTRSQFGSLYVVYSIQSGVSLLVYDAIVEKWFGLRSVMTGTLADALAMIQPIPLEDIIWLESGAMYFLRMYGYKAYVMAQLHGEKV